MSKHEGIPLKQRISNWRKYLEKKSIERNLNPNHCNEAYTYQKIIRLLIFYFNHGDTQKELDNIGTVYYLPEEFKIKKEKEKESNQKNYLITYKKPAETYNDGPERDKPEINQKLELSYDDKGLKKINIEFEEGNVLVTRSNLENSENPNTLFIRGQFFNYSTPPNPSQKSELDQVKKQYITFRDNISNLVFHLYNDLNLYPQSTPEDIPKAVANMANFQNQRRTLEALEDRFGIMLRRSFLKKSAALLALFLVACGVKPTLLTEYVDPNTNLITQGENPNAPQELIDSGAYYDPIYEQIEIAENSDMSQGAKQILYAHLASKVASGYLQTAWQQVATPEFLRTQGILVGDELSQVFQITTKANQGWRYFDPVSNRYIKIAPTTDPIQAQYLRQSYQYYIKGWTAAGMPPEMIAKVQLVEGFTMNGDPAVILVTPNVGYNLEKILRNIRKSGFTNVETVMSTILQDYYSKVLFPMNTSGVLQPDVNFSNICVTAGPDGLRFTPIDLAGKPQLIERGLIYRYQYELLAERAASRGIMLPSFEEYLATNPVARQLEIPTKIGVLSEMSGGNIIRLTVKINGQSMKVLLPGAVFTEAPSIEAITQRIIPAIEAQYEPVYQTIRQGQVAIVRVPNGAGADVSIALIKANSFGDRIAIYGAKWAEILKGLRSGVKIAADVLLILWTAMEFEEFLVPDYRVDLQSVIAFPDSLPSVGSRDTGYILLDSLFNKLMAAKNLIARNAGTNPLTWTPMMEQMFGMTNKDFLELIAYHDVTQQEIIEQFIEMSKTIVFPPAPSIMKFQSPFPILIEGAELPVSAYFSAFQEPTGEQVVFFWANINNNGTSVTIPVAAFTKQPDASEWETINIIEQPWKVEMMITESLNYVLECTQAQSDGQKFELICGPKTP